MIRAQLKQLKTSKSELRKFGFLVGGLFAVLGIVFLLRHRPSGPCFCIIGFLLILFGLISPRGLKYPYIAWMSLAILLGFVMSNLLLVLLFFLVITPIGLAARCSGNDFLSLKLEPSRGSYWIPRQRKPKDFSEYERQF